MNRIILLLAICFLWACQPSNSSESKSSVRVDKSLDSLKAGVACAHPVAARIGAEILESGGNATDAAVAVQWALAVCFPEAGNIGGGGFMVIRRNDGLTTTLDYRERAPIGAFAELFIGPDGEVTQGISTDTRVAAGVPGSVAGIYEMHDKFGSMNMTSLLDPAIDIARNGFPITATQAQRLNENREKFETRNRFRTAFVKDTPWVEGDLLIQEDLAKTLERIKGKGPTEFYSGETAQLILDEMADGRGLISENDLKNYKSKWRNPIKFTFDNFQVISMPPPSSGGIALEQMFKMAEMLKVENIEHNSVEYLHFNTEIERRVYADRSMHLGDPDYYDIPYKELTDSTYLATRLENFRYRATLSSRVSHGNIEQVSESMETTHLSVVDEEGNAVSITTTINGLYGSRIVVSGAGFLLNNQMDDFSSKSGTPNMFGLVGGKANSIEPGKRMLSSMTPAIVEKDGELFLVAGSPGGSTIITSVYQTIANCTYYDMDLKDAIAAPKFHSQWLPDKIFLERDRFPQDVINMLENKGHEIDYYNTLGRVDAIKVSDNGMLEVCGDPRGDDVGAGY
ncbi:MAG: gamma-glutamyltranspeptidase/glutathione hydrolase [Flammeovirgaceae bacterium]|jgi:gamma-glutamyltranspeptidase/glutathione hydrolase